MPATAAFACCSTAGRCARRPRRCWWCRPQALAEAIAAEWRERAGQGGDQSSSHLPLTRLAATGLDRVTTQRERVIDDTAKYGGSDMLCYRAHRSGEPGAAPAPDLAAAARLGGGALRRAARRGRAARRSSPSRRGCGALCAPPWPRTATSHLSALYNLTHIAGSLVIALAVAERPLAGGPGIRRRAARRALPDRALGRGSERRPCGTTASGTTSRPARASSRCSEDAATERMTMGSGHEIPAGPGQERPGRGDGGAQSAVGDAGGRSGLRRDLGVGLRALGDVRRARRQRRVDDPASRHDARDGRRARACRWSPTSTPASATPSTCSMPSSSTSAPARRPS